MTSPAMPSFAGTEVDVCVVGSGAGGAPIARELARRGARVVVLEKGPWYRREDFTHDEIEVVRRHMWVPPVDEEPHLVARDGAPPAPSTDGWIACCVGGGTVHMSGFLYRLDPADFALRARYGALADADLADWPISYADLAPSYDAAEELLGVSGRDAATPFEPPRSRPYPQPPLEENPLAALVDQGARSLGLHPFATPRAILSRPTPARPACVYCDYCGGYGCESGAKSSALEALLPAALATGRCEIRPRSMAFEIGVDARGRAESVRYYDEAGAVAVQRARAIVVAATAIESARLLLNSRSRRFPRGLANRSGLVGRNLTFSTLAKGYGEFELARLPEPLRPHHRVHFLHRSLRDFYFLPDRAGGYDKGGTLNFLLPHRNAIYTAERLARRASPPLWGAALKEALHRAYHGVRELEFELFGEFLPSEGTFVRASESVEDKWGIPAAEIHVQHHPLDLDHARAVAERGLAVLRAAGAGRVAEEPTGGTTYVLQHGTCRFGRDPRTSVLDPTCRAHDVPNLWVTDGSFMPTSGGVPTTLTIVANALRVAPHIAASLGT